MRKIALLMGMVVSSAAMAAEVQVGGHVHVGATQFTDNEETRISSNSSRVNVSVVQDQGSFEAFAFAGTFIDPDAGSMFTGTRDAYVGVRNDANMQLRVGRMNAANLYCCNDRTSFFPNAIGSPEGLFVAGMPGRSDSTVELSWKPGNFDVRGLFVNGEAEAYTGGGDGYGLSASYSGPTYYAQVVALDYDRLGLDEQAVGKVGASFGALDLIAGYSDTREADIQVAMAGARYEFVDRWYAKWAGAKSDEASISTVGLEYRGDGYRGYCSASNGDDVATYGFDAPAKDLPAERGGAYGCGAMVFF